MFSCAFYIMQILHVFIVSFFKHLFLCYVAGVAYSYSGLCICSKYEFSSLSKWFFIFIVIACFVILKLFVVFIDW